MQVFCELRGIDVRSGPRIRGTPGSSASFFVFRKSGGAVGAITTHMDDISGCSGPDLSLEARRFLDKRLSKLELREKSSAHVGVDGAQGDDFSATSTEEDFTKSLEFLLTPPEVAGGSDETRMRQCEFRELRRAAAVSQPDIRARLAKIASSINSLCRGDVYRICATRFTRKLANSSLGGGVNALNEMAEHIRAVGEFGGFFSRRSEAWAQEW